MADWPRRILSVQSHVVSGYVGNKSAAFPLQLLGFEVDCLNSVQFSNHTGYPGGGCGVRGQRLDDQQLQDLVSGLEGNGLTRGYSHAVIGYVGNAAFLKELANVVRRLRSLNPDLVFVCDPVMGDEEPVGWYVPKELLPVYRDEVVPLADVCVPNQFEAELLSGVRISDRPSALKAVDGIHDIGPDIVILSSSSYGCAAECETLASKRHRHGEVERYVIRYPKLPLDFVGTGDLFTATVVAWLAHHGMDIKVALEKTVATMQAVLKRTFEHYQERKDGGGGGGVPQGLPEVALRELKLIQSKRDIEDPAVTILAERL